jgi:hypothetical protein
MAMNLALASEHFGGHRPSHHKKKYIRLLGGSSLINPTHWCGVSGLLCIARGPFPVAAAMVMEVAVGCWPLVAPCLCQDKPHSRNNRNLPTKHIFFGLKYLSGLNSM